MIYGGKGGGGGRGRGGVGGEAKTRCIYRYPENGDEEGGGEINGSDERVKMRKDRD